MDNGDIRVNSRNYLLFRTARAFSDRDGFSLTVKGYRLPFLRGRYTILVEGVHYSDVSIPKGTGTLIEAVHRSLCDPYNAPKKILVRQI